MIQLRQRDFRLWLQARKGNMVGDPTMPHSCPLCRFLKSKGAKSLRMEVSRRNVDGQPHSNPQWAVRFQTDAIAFQRELKVHGLRGHEALNVLDDIICR